MRRRSRVTGCRADTERRKIMAVRSLILITYFIKMWVIVFVIFVFLLITYMYVQWMRTKQYWANRNIPYFPPHPIFGSLTFLLKENPALWFRRVYEQFQVPYVGIWIFWRKALVVNSPDIAKNILIKDHVNFRNRLISSGTTDPVGSLNLMTVDDPVWSMIRRRLTVIFTGSKLRGVQSLLVTKSKELVKRIEKETHLSSSISLRSLMTDFSTDIIGTSSFGMVSDATLTGKSPLRNITKDFTKFNLLRGLAWCCIFFIPELVDVFRCKVFPKEGTEYIRKILRAIIAERGGLENKVTEPRDLLDILIKMRQEGSEEQIITEDMMLAQAILFLQAGFDSTALALCFAIYELAYNPEVQEKLFQELQEAKTVSGNDLWDVQSPYLNCVINEVLRKYTAISWLDRVAINDYKVDDHLTIKAGTPVLINVAGIHYDPNHYIEPDRFNPDRFLRDSDNNIKSCTFLPFGEGPRKCIGQRFGLSIVLHGLAAIVLNYEVRPLPDSPQPSDIILSKRGLGVAPENELYVEFISRN